MLRRAYEQADFAAKEAFVKVTVHYRILFCPFLVTPAPISSLSFPRPPFLFHALPAMTKPGISNTLFTIIPPLYDGFTRIPLPPLMIQCMPAMTKPGIPEPFAV